MAPNPAELLSSPNLENTLSNLAQWFDWVVVDSPPILGLADGCVLAALCDATVLVVQANKTPAKLVKDAIHRLGRDRICGVVINRYHLHSSRYLYQHSHLGNGDK